MGRNARRPARVPAGDLRRTHLPARRQRGTARRSTSTPAARLGATGSATLSASTPAVTSNTRLRDRARQRPLEAPGRIVALNSADRRDPLVADAAERRASPRRCSTHGRVFFGSQNGTVYALNAQQRSRDLDLPRRRRGQGEPDPLRRRALLRRLLRATCRRSPSSTGHRLWISGSEGALLGSGTFYSTAAVDLRARLPRQHRRAHLRLRRPHRHARLGRADRRLRVRLPRRHDAPGHRPDGLPRLLRRHLLRAQRAHRADQLELRRGREDLRLGRRSSGASSTSPTSATTASTGSGSQPGHVVFADGHAAPSTRPSATATTSTSPATRPVRDQPPVALAGASAPQRRPYRPRPSRRARTRRRRAGRPPASARVSEKRASTDRARGAA